MPTLPHLRSEINELDISLITTLAKRIQKGIEIQVLKQAYELPIEDKKREQEILQTLKQYCKQYRLSPQFIDSIYSLIFQEVKNGARTKEDK